MIGSFGERFVPTSGGSYPYWENALRLTEDSAAALLALTVLFALCPLTFAVVIAVKYIRRGHRYVKKAVPERLEAAVEERREQRLEKEYEKNAGGE